VGTIVGAMKAFSHPGTAERTPTDLNRAVENTLTVARNEWKYVADAVTDLDPNLPLIPCYPADLNQAILNLVINAAHAVGAVVREGDAERGRIAVLTRQDGAWVEIRVEDSGCGIPEEIRDRIFDPFFTTKSVGEGTGQGLTQVHSVVVDRHRGTISVESEVGRGSVFILRLPLTDDAAQEGAE